MCPRKLTAIENTATWRVRLLRCLYKLRELLRCGDSRICAEIGAKIAQLEKQAANAAEQ